MLFWCLATLLSLQAARAQEATAYHKLGASLKLWLAKEKARPAEKKTAAHLDVFIEITSDAVLPVLQQNKVAIHTKAGNILSASLPTWQLFNLAALPGIKRIELPQALHPADEKMKQSIGATPVHNGRAPMQSGYKGKGMLIGVIDDGIDITHPDFYTPEGKSRIQYLWNMEYFPVGLPTPAVYGYEWTRDSIEFYAEAYRQKRLNRDQMMQRFGYANHGTPVAGVAAGNGGVAPDAELVVVAMTATVNKVLSTKYLLDGIAYIYSKAKAQRKKCIVNISLGVSDGAPHHGKSLVEKAIDAYCAERPDLLVCASAGNNGNNWKHWGGFPIRPDSSFGFFYNSSEAALYFAIPRTYRDSLRFSVAESDLGNLNNVHISPDSVFYQTPYVTLQSLINGAAPVLFESKNRKGETKSYFTLAASAYDDEYDELILSVNSLSPNPQQFDPHLYRFIFKGSGIVHAWFPFWNLHPVFLFDRNPLPNDPSFHLSDNAYTTVIPSNAQRVLSVGAYNLRTCYTSIQNTVLQQYPVCRLTYFTSYGPTLDGRIKPEMIAPGENVMAPRSRMDDFLGHQTIVDTNTVSFGGTSCSSPIVAGAAALLWGLFPEITAEAVKMRLMETARQDEWTLADGPAPNYRSGWGKLDVYKAVTGITLPDSLCGLMDVCTTAPVPQPPQPPASGYYRVFPNPATGVLYLEYASYFPVQMGLYNAVGQLLWKGVAPAAFPALQKQRIPVTAFSNGVYFLRLASPDIRATEKIVLQRN